MPLFRRLGSAMVIVALPFLQLVFEPSSLQKLMTVMSFGNDDSSRVAKPNSSNTTAQSQPHIAAWQGRPDLLQHNRFFLGLQQDDNLPPPLSVMKTYIQQHNSDVLKQEWTDCTTNFNCHALQSRNYLTATYACPMEAGNRMHRFMNGLLWAVLTNRTFLYRYHTVGVCEEYESDDTSRCEELFHSPGLFGNSTDCDGILHLHDWVPSFDEWAERLQLHNVTRAQLHPKQPPDNTTLPFDALHSPRIIRTGVSYQLSPGDILYGDGGSRHLQQSDNIMRLQKLTNITTNTPNDKVYFLYGMLQEALFTIDEKNLMGGMDMGMDNSTTAVGVVDNADHKILPQSMNTFVLHSRHTGTHPDNYIWPEHMCLERIHNATTTNDDNTTTRPRPNCHIYVMSDRETTLQLLHAEIDQSTNCSHSSVNSTSITSTPSFNGEHGPFAGRGFWQDLVMSSQARHGMIAFHMHSRPHGLVRTSSALVRERIEFRRTLEWYKEYHSMPPPPFWQCQNPWKEQ